MAAYFAALHLMKRKLQRDEIAKKILRDLQNPFSLDDDVFKKKFCLNKEGVRYIAEMFGPLLKRHHGYPIELTILTSLQVLGSGCYQNKIGEEQIIKVSQATVSRSLDAFLEAIIEFMPKLIEFPSPSELAFSEQKQYGQSKIPNVMGILNSMHVLILKPHAFNAEEYVNEKEQYSINVQLVCDSDLNILDAVVEWPGSTVNYAIWKESSLRNFLRYNSFAHRAYLLGDSSYPLEPWLLVPYDDCQKSEELIFNDHLQRALTVSQQCIATIRKRFRCLHHKSAGLHYTPEKCSKIITACLFLHNVCMKLNIDLDEPVDLTEDVYEMPQSMLEFEEEETLMRHEAMGIRDDVAKQLLLSA